MPNTVNLDELEAALEAASPRPWWVGPHDRLHTLTVQNAGQYLGIDVNATNAIAITKAINALPDLIAELRNLRTAAAEQKAQPAPADA